MFCLHSVFMCFVWIWEQTAIISLYSTNWLVFITEMECVYCAVRTESLNTIQENLQPLKVRNSNQSRLMDKTVPQFDFSSATRRKVWQPKPINQCSFFKPLILLLLQGFESEKRSGVGDEVCRSNPECPDRAICMVPYRSQTKWDRFHWLNLPKTEDCKLLGGTWYTEDSL